MKERSAAYKSKLLCHIIFLSFTVDKPVGISDVLLTMRTQRTDDNPTEMGVDGKVNLYTSPLGKVRIDGNLGYSRLLGVPPHLASPTWDAGLEVNLLQTLFLRGGLTFRF